MKQMVLWKIKVACVKCFGLLQAIVLLTVLPARAVCAQNTPSSRESETAPAQAVDSLIPSLLDESRQLRGIAFSEVIFDTTGKRVLPVDPKNETDQRIIKQISGAMDKTMQWMNASQSPIQSITRINEVSSHFEDALRELLNAEPGFPDLRIVDLASKRVFYLDPKLYAVGSRDSSFRAFYFEPKIATNKVRDDAVHFIAGFEHEPRKEGHWKFTRWDLVNLAQFKVKLKAEFQGSNRDMYRPEAIVATSAK